MKGNFKYKFIIVNTVIIFCLIVIVYGLAYFLSVKEYKRHIRRNNLQTIKQFGAVVDSRVQEQVLSFPNLYFADNEQNKAFIQPMTKKINVYGVDVLHVNKKVIDIIHLNEFMVGLDIYYELNHLMFINGKMKSLADSATETDNIPNWFQYVDSYKKPFYMPTYHNEFLHKDVTSYIYKLPLTYKNYDTMIAIHIDTLALQDLLINLNQEEKDKTLGIVDREGHLITSTTDDTHNNELMKEVLSYAMDNQLDSDALFNYEKESIKYMAAKVKSNYNDWYYISIMPVNGFYTLSTYMYLSLIIPAIVVLASIFFIIFINSRLYRPMDKVVTLIKNIPDSKYDPKDYDEYSLLTNKLTYLVDEMEDLQNKIEINRPAIFHSTIHRMLRGTDKIRIDHFYKEAGILFNKPYAFCFVIKMTWTEEYNKLLAVEYALLERLMEVDEYKIYSIVEDNRILGIVNYDENDDLKKIYASIQHVLASSIEEEKFVIAVGHQSSLEQGKIKESYCSALEALKYYFIKPHQNMIVYDEEGFESYKTSGSSHQVIHRIGDYIRESNQDSIDLTINGLIESLVVGQYSIEYCMNTLQDVASTIRRTFNELGLNTDLLLGYDLREYYKHMESITTYKVWINEIVTFLFDTIREGKKDEAEELLRHIKKIVQDNIYNDISLDMVADQLNMRYDTLSRTFKSMTGKTFSSYVKEIKLANAVELVLEGNYTVKDISQKLGYSSTHYFIKLFKQVYSMTPKQYQLHMKKQK